LDIPTEIIFVDDGSSDKSFDIISHLSQKDARVKCLRFSRNFGSHAALLAGLRKACGAAAVIISADLQDPPELIRDLVEKWRQGYHTVWAVRESRKDPFAKKLFAATFYRLFRRIALPNYPPSGMDFGLFDRRILDNLKRLHEINYFIPGLILWLGFRQAYISYHRRSRHSGRSKWTVRKRTKNAVDAIVSFSYFPIRLISYTGFFVSLLAFLYVVFLVTRKLFFGLGTPGWVSVFVAVLFLGGLQLMMLGILGEYIWRTTDQVRSRPSYILMDQIGFDDIKPQDEEGL